MVPLDLSGIDLRHRLRSGPREPWASHRQGCPLFSYLESKSSTASRRYSLCAIRVRRESSRSLSTFSCSTNTWVLTTPVFSIGPWMSGVLARGTSVGSEMRPVPVMSCLVVFPLPLHAATCLHRGVENETASWRTRQKNRRIQVWGKKRLG